MRQLGNFLALHGNTQLALNNCLNQEAKKIDGEERFDAALLLEQHRSDFVHWSLRASSKARLEKLIFGANANWLRYSESFDDGLELLMAADRMKLEGIATE
jgi:hypothetical protein